MDSYVGRKEKQHSVKTIPVYREALFVMYEQFVYSKEGNCIIGGI